MFNMYRRRFYARSGPSNGSDEQLGHDRFNYMHPNVNYDKWPRRLRPKKSVAKVELEAPESPNTFEDPSFCDMRDCNGSMREHERLLNLRAQRHKCSPRCQVKSPKTSTTNLSTEALVKVFACLGVQESVEAQSSPTSWNEQLQEKQQCIEQHFGHPLIEHGSNSIKLPKKFSFFSPGSHMHGFANRLVRDGKSYDSSGEEGSCEGRVRLMSAPKRQGVDSRDAATELCRQYIRSSTRYVLLDHMQDIGSRVDKSWFMIRDTSVKTERLLSVLPLPPTLAQGSCNSIHGSVSELDRDDNVTDTTRAGLVDLFTALQHPYIYPVLDVDFVYGGASVGALGLSYEQATRPVLVSVVPFNSKGSLKDLIYRSHWQDDWTQKYRQRSEGLPLQQVQRLGRQILEALLFLKEKGFLPFGHLHSGNVIIQNGVARLTGFENTLLGFSSRIHPLVKGILSSSTPADAIDTLCFGHVLFEMCAGYELYAPRPTSRHLEDMQAYPQVVEILNCIFNTSPDHNFPSIEILSMMEFFRNIDLREMRCSTIYFTAKLTDAATNLLEQVHPKVDRTSGNDATAIKNFETIRRCHGADRKESHQHGALRRTNACLVPPPSPPPLKQEDSQTSLYCSTDDSFRTPLQSPDLAELRWGRPLTLPLDCDLNDKINRIH